MEKKMKKMKSVVIILLTLLISLIAFLGFFKQNKGVWNNIIPNYKYGMDIEGSREIRYSVDNSETDEYVYVDENGNIMGEVWKDGNRISSEEEKNSTDNEQTTEEGNNDEVTYLKETRKIKANSDNVLTKESFEKVKKIIQNRLDDQDISEYNIRVDDITGKIVVETANDNNVVENVEYLMGHAGRIKIIDYQNGLELMDNSDIKNASAVYSNNGSLESKLQIEFNKEGAEKLREISKKYVEIKKEKSNDENNTDIVTEEKTENEEETTIKYIAIVLDDSTIMTTYFGEEMTQGILQIPIGEKTTDTEKFLENQNKARRMATIINSGIFPVKYNIETDNFVKSEVGECEKNTVKIILLTVIAVLSLIFIIKFKAKGLIASIMSIGFVALLSLTIRYTNVSITLNSLVASCLVISMNYIFTFVVLKKFEENNKTVLFGDMIKKLYLNILPVLVIAIVFTFATSLQISSIGMILFWGSVLIAIYNVLFTKNVLK